jgi:hypothetical protein
MLHRGDGTDDLHGEKVRQLRQPGNSIVGGNFWAERQFGPTNKGRDALLRVHVF